MDNIEEYIAVQKNVWVFGYGSLVWKTGFKFTSKKIGYIDDYVRRFWQGCPSHRGTPDSPGRVATLVKKDKARTWGVGFELVGQEEIQEAMLHLGMRECKMGGYIIEVVPFYCRETKQQHPCILFNALQSNKNFLGSASTEALAKQIYASTGPSGHNVEYVTRLTDYIRAFIPEETDEHLFGIDRYIRKWLKRDNVCLDTLLKTAEQNAKNLVSSADDPLYESLWKTWRTDEVRNNSSIARRVSVDCDCPGFF